MDIKLEKIELMKKLLETEDVTILKSIKKIFQKKDKDWWDELPESAKLAIEEGEKDIANGRVFSYDEIKNEFGWK